MQHNLFTEAEITTSSPAIAKPIVSRSTFYHGDCLVEMDKIADKSVDLLFLDPPYFYLYSEEWDKQWKSLDEYKLWLNMLFVKAKRILKNNGSIICFCSQLLNDIVCGMIRENFHFLSNIVWDKTHAAGAEKGVAAKTIRKPVSKTERIIFASAKENPFGDRIRVLLEKYKKTQSELVEYCTGKRTGLVGLWLCERHKHGACEPTNKMWNKVCDFFNIPYDYIDIARPFNSEHLPYDLITMLPVTGKHPCEKPLKLIDLLIKATTNEGAIVADLTFGSGTTGVACKKTGRHFIGIEKDETYFKLAVDRVSAYCG